MCLVLVDYLVSKDGIQNATDPALVDINATTGALVPQQLVLPWTRRLGKSEIAKPSNTLKRHEGLANETCTFACFGHC